jgi:hypothetical protein
MSNIELAKTKKELIRITEGDSSLMKFQEELDISMGLVDEKDRLIVLTMYIQNNLKQLGEEFGKLKELLSERNK